MLTDTSALPVLQKLTQAGHQAYFVGGCVRDHLLGNPIKDIDIATSATPDEVRRLFPNVQHVGASFGVCIVPFSEHKFEVATFRKDGVYMDGRRPEDVVFGSIEDDAQRRDFTINALYMDQDGEIIDLVDGLRDIERRKLRCVGNPVQRFEEDSLRLLRAIRFALKDGLGFDAPTWDALRDAAPSIERVSPERIQMELTRIYTHKTGWLANSMLRGAGLLELLLPEVAALETIQDQGPYHPEGDALRHTDLCLRSLEKRTSVLVWATLLHDIGKVPTHKIVDGRPRFIDHENIGADMAEAILRRLRFSNDEREAIVRLVRRHMLPVGEVSKWRKSTLKRFLADEQCDDLMELHKADVLGSNGDLASHRELTTFASLFASLDEPVKPDPLITGRDLIAAGFRPGPAFGTILQKVEDEQLEGTLANREDALAFVLNTFDVA